LQLTDRRRQRSEGALSDPLKNRLTVAITRWARALSR